MDLIIIVVGRLGLMCSIIDAIIASMGMFVENTATKRFQSFIKLITSILYIVFFIIVLIKF